MEASGVSCIDLASFRPVRRAPPGLSGCSLTGSFLLHTARKRSGIAPDYCSPAPADKRSPPGRFIPPGVQFGCWGLKMTAHLGLSAPFSATIFCFGQMHHETHDHIFPFLLVVESVFV